MSLRGRIAMAGATDTGQVRDHNEDAIAHLPDVGLLVLADGMGGLKAGEIASAMAVEVVTAELEAELKGIEAGHSDQASGYALESLAVGAAVLKANATIFGVAQTQPQCAGMGTTLVVVLFYDNRFTVAHVGDSRLYRLRQNQLEQVTQDHSLVQELVDRGFYTPEEARHASNRNIVTRALGIGDEVTYDMQEEVALVGDVLLLCSDGLNDMLADELIRQILVEHQHDLEKATQALVDTANAYGGRDNISVIAARVDRPFSVRKGWLRQLTGWLD